MPRPPKYANRKRTKRRRKKRAAMRRIPRGLSLIRTNQKPGYKGHHSANNSILHYGTTKLTHSPQEVPPISQARTSLI